MNQPTKYSPYINPARTEARQNSKDSSDEYGHCIGEPIQAMMGYWGKDAEWCIYLKNQRKGITNE
jgi:hypothetical protein